MVQAALRGPAGEGAHPFRRRLERGFAVQRAHFRRVEIAVEVAHQHQPRFLRQQVGQETQLQLPRLHAQRQVGDGQRPGLLALAVFRHQHAAAGDAAGQGVIEHFGRFHPAQQRVAAARDARDAPVRLVAPERELRLFGQVIGLVGETRTQAARVRFLQPHHVVIAGHLRQRVEVDALAVGQHVRPAAGDVVAVGARARTGLDIGAEQAQAVVGGFGRDGGHA